MKKGIVPLILMLAVSLIVALSCEKVEKALGITISGNVSNAGQPVEGAYVLLVNNVSEIVAGSPLSNGMITLGNGNYTIIQVEDGTYYVVAVKDENGNTSYDLGTDLIGWYGHRDSLTGLTIPDPVIISGSDMSNIDIDTMYAQ